ncbi:MAG: hypothetical protein HOD68_05550 [Flavobacteriales bacterium]|nr:hypothetical protein [Flavobacteriales bacterium]
MRYIILSILITFNYIGLSQSHSVYIGTIISTDNNPISYKLDFTEDNGIISGYSITNIGTNDETKSKIIGTYISSEKTLHIKETEILTTNSQEPLENFCFIEMKLEKKGIFGSKRLEGEFNGYFLNKKKCAIGRIIMIEEKKLRKIKKKIKKKIELNKRERVKEEEEEILMKSGEKFTFDSENKKITLLIWDANQEDGDKIDLLLNSVTILSNYETKNKARKIRIKLEDGKNIIEVKATNEGINPPNTSRIELIDGKTKYTVDVQLQHDKNITIEINK